MFVTTPIYYGPEDEGGAAPVVEAPPEGEVVEPVVEEPPEGELPPEGEQQPAPVDWDAKVQGWGGEDAVAEALQLQQALRSREGVEALFHEAGRALGLGDAAIAALFGTEPAGGQAPEGEPTVEELLADPDRILTAGEVARIIASDRTQAQQQTQAQQTAQAVVSTIDTTFTDLKVTDEDDRIAILTLADQLLPSNKQGDTQAVAGAIRTAHDRYQAKVQERAEAIVRQRHETNEQLPSPLPTGGGGAGSELVEEPKNVAEAKVAARKALGIN